MTPISLLLIDCNFRSDICHIVLSTLHLNSPLLPYVYIITLLVFILQSWCGITLLTGLLKIIAHQLLTKRLEIVIRSLKLKNR